MVIEMACSGQIHKIHLEPDGSAIAVDHDLPSEVVLSALGGLVTSCDVATQLWRRVELPKTTSEFMRGYRERIGVAALESFDQFLLSVARSRPGLAQFTQTKQSAGRSHARAQANARQAQIDRLIGRGASRRAALLAWMYRTSSLTINERMFTPNSEEQALMRLDNELATFCTASLWEILPTTAQDHWLATRSLLRRVPSDS